MSTHEPFIRFIVPAAGLGTRLGHDRPKALAPLAGTPLIVHTLGTLDDLGHLDGAVVLCPSGYREHFFTVLDDGFPARQISVYEGGLERQDSVRLGTEEIAEDVDLIAVHDAARPFVDAAVAQHAIDLAWKHGGATVATRCTDTILEASDEGFLERTPDRDRLWSCATPQIFWASAFRDAHRRAYQDERRYTDDASLYRAYGGRVKLVEGNRDNLKITTTEDLDVAEHWIARRNAAT